MKELEEKARKQKNAIQEKELADLNEVKKEIMVNKETLMNLERDTMIEATKRTHLHRKYRIVQLGLISLLIILGFTLNIIVNSEYQDEQSIAKQNQVRLIVEGFNNSRII